MKTIHFTEQDYQIISEYILEDNKGWIESSLHESWEYGTWKTTREFEVEYADVDWDEPYKITGRVIVKESSYKGDYTTPGGYDYDVTFELTSREFPGTDFDPSKIMVEFKM